MKNSNTYNKVNLLSRRGFVKFLGAGALLTLAPSLSACTSLGEAVSGEREFTDDEGRNLEIPTAGKLERVYFTSGLAQNFLFTLKPEVQAGTAAQFTKEQKKFLPESMHNLTYMGSLADDGEINREMLMAEKVQLVLSISAVGLSESNISDAKKLQESTNIPVCLLDGSMDKISDCYRKLGSILGCEARAEELASYCEDVMSRVTAAVATIPESERIGVFYAEGPEGLQTEPNVSQHAVAFDIAGAYNVAQVPENVGVGMSNVSLEQVMAWKPEVIIAWDAQNMGGADEYIRAGGAWSRVPAVQNGRVYTMPCIPFSWLDRPPAVNRFLGIQWLANLLYPKVFDVDMVKVGQDFYEKFYWVRPTEDEMREILGNSYGA